MYFGKNQTFQRNFVSIFRAEKQVKKEISRSRREDALGLLFDPEDGDDMFLRNVGLRRPYSS
jgi:hypothetical protein